MRFINCADSHSGPEGYVYKLGSMGVKFYTHFISQETGEADYEEYRGVVEVSGRAQRCRGDREIAQVLARSFDLEPEDIQILQWQQLH